MPAQESRTSGCLDDVMTYVIPVGSYEAHSYEAQNDWQPLCSCLQEIDTDFQWAVRIKSRLMLLVS